MLVVTQAQNDRILMPVLQWQQWCISVAGWSGGKLGKKWVCEVLSWSTSTAVSLQQSVVLSWIFQISGLKKQLNCEVTISL